MQQANAGSISEKSALRCMVPLCELHLVLVVFFLGALAHLLMCTQTNCSAPLLHRDHPLQDVNSFPYLGSIITPENGMMEEFDMRIGRAQVCSSS